jgi:osmotically-inducible protein OsmY
MEYDPQVGTNDLTVTVEDGVVTMTGNVVSYGTKDAIEKAAWRIAGVCEVHNNVVVDPKALNAIPDDEIAANVRNRLDKDFLVPKGRVGVSVMDGNVTLTGTVGWNLQREAAQHEAQYTEGARSVTNLIRIDKYGASPKDVRAEITSALVRHAQVDAGNVTITADGGHVTLSGSVSTAAERQEAEDAAWRADGVTEVTNNITVQPW